MKKIIFVFIITLIFCNVFFLDTYKDLIGGDGDNYEFLGFMNLAKQNILEGKFPFSDTDTLRYPTGFNFSFGFDGVLPVITGALLSIFLDPVLSYNITVVLILFFNIIISFYFFKKISILYPNSKDNDLKAFISALIFGASPYVFARMSAHLNLYFVAGFPAVMYFICLLYQKIIQKNYQLKKSEIYLIWISILLLSFGSLQYLIMLALLSPIFIILIIKNKYHIELYNIFIKNYKNILISFIFFIAIFLYFYHGYFLGILTGNISTAHMSSKYFAPHPIDFVAPNQYLGKVWSIFNPSSLSIERIYTMGIVETLLLIYLFLSKVSRKLKITTAIIWFFYIFLSLNIIPVPYLPEPGRLILFPTLYLCCLILTQSQFINKKYLLYLIIVLLFIERLFFEVQHVRIPGADIFKLNVAPLDGEAVLNVPLSKYNAYRSILPIFYEKKIMDGYFHYTAFNEKSDKTLDQDYASRLVCRGNNLFINMKQNTYTKEDRDNFYHWLKDNKISAAVLIKNDNLGKFYFDECRNVRDFWFWVNPITSTVKQGEVKTTFDLFAYNPINTAQLYFEKEGKFSLERIFIAPAAVNDFAVILPNKDIIYPQWQTNESGLLAEFNPPLEIYASAGESIFIDSPQKSYDNRSIFVYYNFEVNKSSLTSISPRLEQIYGDKEFEIFKVN